MKFFSHCDQYAIQNLKKLENFEKSINQNKFLGGKINEDSKYPKNNNIIPSYIQTNLGGNNKKMFDEEEDIKKKRSDISYSNYSNSIYGNRKKKKTSEESQTIDLDQISFKPALGEIKKNNLKFEPSVSRNNINSNNNMTNISNISDEIDKKPTFKKFVPCESKNKLYTTKATRFGLISIRVRRRNHKGTRWVPMMNIPTGLKKL